MFVVMNQMWHLGHALTDLFCEIEIVQQALTLISTYKSNSARGVGGNVQKWQSCSIDLDLP